MKKEYLQPCSVVYNVNSQSSILQGSIDKEESPATGGNGYDNNGDGLVKEEKFLWN